MTVDVICPPELDPEVYEAASRLLLSERALRDAQEDNRVCRETLRAIWQGDPRIELDEGQICWRKAYTKSGTPDIESLLGMHATIRSTLLQILEDRAASGPHITNLLRCLRLLESIPRRPDSQIPATITVKLCHSK